MRTLLWVTTILGAALLVREAWVAMVPQRQLRRSLYAAAVERARDTGKTLLVLGAPNRGIVQRFFGADYGCGAMCVDPSGCSTCETYVRGRLEDVLPQFGDDSAVIFAANVLEYADDAAMVAAQMDRVSGGDLFVATVDPATIAAWIWPGARRRVVEAPPIHTEVVYKPLPWHPEPAALGAPAQAHIIEMPRFVARSSTPRTIDTTGEALP